VGPDEVFEPWGKIAHDLTGCVVREQSLKDHCADVAAVFDAIVETGQWSARLARLAGMEKLHRSVRARLAYLVYLHDCGKVNAGFQARRDKRVPVVGHIAPLATIIGDRAAPELQAQALDALNAERLAMWCAEPILDAILSHHGAPWPCDRDLRREARHWRPSADGYDPIQALAELVAAADRFVPGALEAPGMPLPDSPGFVHAVAGLAQAADWIASSDWERDVDAVSRPEWAAERLRTVGMDVESWRGAVREDMPSFEALFGNPPYPHQDHAAAAPGRLVVLESETGSGKTEAALSRFRRLFARGEVDGLYFALPTRTAAAQLHRRVESFASRLWPEAAPPVVLAVPAYLDENRTRAASGSMPPAQDPNDEPEADTRIPGPWASEHPKRYFAGVIGVGTIDQALLATLRVKHAHMRGALLSRHLLVIDEVHASDAYMRRLLGHLLRDHVAAGGHAMLLSATLGAEARQQLLVEAAGGRAVDDPAPTLAEAEHVHYPLLSLSEPSGEPIRIDGVSRERTILIKTAPWLDDPEAVARCALDAAERGAKVLVVRNTVDGAMGVQQAMERIAGADNPLHFQVRGVATLHHGRFAREDRRLLDSAVEACLGRSRASGALVVVGTQTLEQSLDIDADLLLTDLCPADVLLQRLGRLHRHVREADGTARPRPGGFDVPAATVLVPANGLAEFLRPRRPGGARRHGLGHSVVSGVPKGVYRDLAVLEATRRLIETHGVWQIPAMNRLLVERSLHSDAIEALIASMEPGLRGAWDKHRQTVTGDQSAQSQIASDGVLRRHRGFREDANARFDDTLATRLGADDRLLPLPLGTVGPFGQIVGRIAVPRWMVRDVAVDAAPIITTERTTHGERLHIALDTQRFVYDRLGLRRAEETG
jgi:CRISPR-associated endonuclease/helicase Cas3